MKSEIFILRFKNQACFRDVLKRILREKIRKLRNANYEIFLYYALTNKLTFIVYPIYRKYFIGTEKETKRRRKQKESPLPSPQRDPENLIFGPGSKIDFD